MTAKQEAEFAIHNLRTEANRLLELASQPPILGQLALALEDLADAERALTSTIFKSPAVALQLAQFQTGLADWKLENVRRAIKTLGADVTLIG